MIIKNINKKNPVIAWWSGGIASAITCHLCIQWFGIENVRIVFQDTWNEDDDTYRFLSDCENWYGCKIERICNKEFDSIEQVWYKYQSLNVATGAICSTHLKRLVREQFQKENMYSYQAFGFDTSEIDRALSMKFNHPDARPIFPLISECLDKRACMKYLPTGLFTIEPPRVYKLGYQNNNCFKTGCVQGGIGYWQKIQREDIKKFDRMATIEHELTDLKKEPVTMLKDQSKGGGLVFLKPHPQYPNMKDISMMKGRDPKPLMDCNGFCGTNDLNPNRNETESELNYAGIEKLH